MIEPPLILVFLLQTSECKLKVLICKCYCESGEGIIVHSRKTGNIYLSKYNKYWRTEVIAAKKYTDFE